jgi:hypothetical protein
MAEPGTPHAPLLVPLASEERLRSLEERIAALERHDAPGARARQGRHYQASPLPFLQPDGTSPPRESALLVFYTQACSTRRELVAVRFKLLAQVPSVSLLLLVQLLPSTGVGGGPTVAVKTGLALAGFIAVLGFFIYDLRNSTLHDDLISRARRIEEELGVDTGQFRGRLKARSWLVKHDRAWADLWRRPAGLVGCGRRDLDATVANPSMSLRLPSPPPLSSFRRAHASFAEASIPHECASRRVGAVGLVALVPHDHRSRRSCRGVVGVAWWHRPLAMNRGSIGSSAEARSCSVP